MSLRDLNLYTRRRLRLHGWLLSAWRLAVGGVANVLLAPCAGLGGALQRVHPGAVSVGDLFR